MRTTAVILGLLIVVFAGAWLLRDRPVAPEPAPETTASAVGESTPEAEPSAVPPPSPAETADAVAEQALELEAEAFLNTLTQTELEPIAVESADHFMRADQAISLIAPETIEALSAEEILADPELRPDSPITVVKEIEQVETITPEKLIAESGGDLEQRVKVLENDEVREATVREVLESRAADPEKPILVVKKVQYFEVTTPRELEQELDQMVPGERLVGIIRRPYQIEAATLADLLMAERVLEPDAVFYVRTVRGSDEQGVWGIVQSGLVENFARGIAVRRGEEINTYRVEIPPLADEVLVDRTSSFLGRLIHAKTLDSFVYNFRHHRMGRNPDVLHPGQELLIIKFNPDELISIYKHFVNEQS